MLRCKGFSRAREHYLYAFPLHLFVKPSISNPAVTANDEHLYCMGSPRLKEVNCLLHVSCCALVASEFVVMSS